MLVAIFNTEYLKQSNLESDGNLLGFGSYLQKTILLNNLFGLVRINLLFFQKTCLPKNWR
jgi:hypothetical protein